MWQTLTMPNSWCKAVIWINLTESNFLALIIPSYRNTSIIYQLYIFARCSAELYTQIFRQNFLFPRTQFWKIADPNSFRHIKYYCGRNCYCVLGVENMGNGSQHTESLPERGFGSWKASWNLDTAPSPLFSHTNHMNKCNF